MTNELQTPSTNARLVDDCYMEVGLFEDVANDDSPDGRLGTDGKPNKKGNKTPKRRLTGGGGIFRNLTRRGSFGSFLPEIFDPNDPDVIEDRKLILSCPVQFISNSHRRSRFLFLYEDILICAKQKSQATFHLKNRIDLRYVWVSEYTNCKQMAREEEGEQVEDVLGSTSCSLGWPIMNTRVQFSTREEKDLWLKTLKELIAIVRKEESHSTIVKIAQNDENYSVTKSIYIGKFETAKNILIRCMDEFHIKNNSPEDFQLSVLHSKNEPSIPLTGPENLYCIQMKYNRTQQQNEKENAPENEAELSDGLVFLLLKEKKTRPTKRSLSSENNKPEKRPSFSQFFKTTFKQPDEGKLFRRNLNELCKDGKLCWRLMMMLSYLFEYGPKFEGIFRKAPAVKKNRENQDLLDKGKGLDCDKITACEMGQLLKSFLMSLPDCLLMCELYPRWAEMESISDKDKLITFLKSLVAELPENNRILLRHLMCVLHHVVANHKVNLMPSAALSPCIGQCLLWSPLKLSAKDIIIQASIANKVANKLIDNVAEIFGDDCLHLFDKLLLHRSISGGHDVLNESLNTQGPSQDHKNAVLMQETVMPQCSGTAQHLSGISYSHISLDVDNESQTEPFNEDIGAKLSSSWQLSGSVFDLDYIQPQCKAVVNSCQSSSQIWQLEPIKDSQTSCKVSTEPALEIRQQDSSTSFSQSKTKWPHMSLFTSSDDITTFTSPLDITQSSIDSVMSDGVNPEFLANEFDQQSTFSLDNISRHSPHQGLGNVSLLDIEDKSSVNFSISEEICIVPEEESTEEITSQVPSSLANLQLEMEPDLASQQKSILPSTRKKKICQTPAPSKIPLKDFKHFPPISHLNVVKMSSNLIDDNTLHQCASPVDIPAKKSLHYSITPTSTPDDGYCSPSNCSISALPINIERNFQLISDKSENNFFDIINQMISNNTVTTERNEPDTSQDIPQTGSFISHGRSTDGIGKILQKAETNAYSIPFVASQLCNDIGQKKLSTDKAVENTQLSYPSHSVETLHSSLSLQNQLSEKSCNNEISTVELMYSPPTDLLSDIQSSSMKTSEINWKFRLKSSITNPNVMATNHLDLCSESNDIQKKIHPSLAESVFNKIKRQPGVQQIKIERQQSDKSVTTTTNPLLQNSKTVAKSCCDDIPTSRMSRSQCAKAAVNKFQSVSHAAKNIHQDVKVEYCKLQRNTGDSVDSSDELGNQSQLPPKDLHISTLKTTIAIADKKLTDKDLGTTLTFANENNVNKHSLEPQQHSSEPKIILIKSEQRKIERSNSETCNSVPREMEESERNKENLGRCPQLKRLSLIKQNSTPEKLLKKSAEINNYNQAIDEPSNSLEHRNMSVKNRDWHKDLTEQYNQPLPMATSKLIGATKKASQRFANLTPTISYTPMPKSYFGNTSKPSNTANVQRKV